MGPVLLFSLPAAQCVFQAGIHGHLFLNGGNLVALSGIGRSLQSAWRDFTTTFRWSVVRNTELLVHSCGGGFACLYASLLPAVSAVLHRIRPRPAAALMCRAQALCGPLVLASWSLTCAKCLLDNPLIRLVLVCSLALCPRLDDAWILIIAHALFNTYLDRWLTAIVEVRATCQGWREAPRHGGAGMPCTGAFAVMEANHLASRRRAGLQEAGTERDKEAAVAGG